MLQRLKLRSDPEKQQRRAKHNVVLVPGEGLGIKYEWAKGRRGPHIADIEPKGAADRAGLQVGSVVWSINGKRTPDHHALVEIIKEMRVKGGCYEVEVLGARSLPGTPVVRPATKPRANTQPPTESLLHKASDTLSGLTRFPKSLTKPLLNADEVSVKSSATTPLPKLYEVVCPSQPDVEGTYKITNERFNDSAVWAGESGRRLYCTKSGLWALVDCADGPERNIALVSSRRQGKGRAPHSIHWAEWQCWDGAAWMAAPVRIEELRIDDVDGRPYWKGAFVEYYGQEAALKKWAEAASECNLTVAEVDARSETTSSRDGRSVSGLTDDASDDDLMSILSMTRNGSTYEPPSLTMVSA